MATSEEYRQHAAKCVLLAEETNNPGTRLALMEMAQAWLRLAEQAEKNSKLDLVYETPSPRRTRAAQ